jgi:P4 family phage/plasmid primase-like protien
MENINISNTAYDDIKKVNNNDSMLKSYINNKSKEYSNLIKFLNNFVIKKNNPNYDTTMNIIDVHYKKTYAIDLHNITEFFRLLEDCRLKKLELNFSEIQKSDLDKRIGSGLMLDFDILTDDCINILDNIDMKSLIKYMMETIHGIIDFRLKSNVDEYDNINTNIQNVIIIKKEKIEYKDRYKKYKNGIHILFPGIKITKDTKKFILSKMLESEDLKQLFQRTPVKFNEILDTNSASVPVFFFGCCKVNGKPYLLDKVYRIKLMNEKVSEPIDITNKFEGSNTNLCYEFSLNYTDETGLITNKTFYKPHGYLVNDIIQSTESQDDEEVNDEEIDYTLFETINNIDHKYIKGLLECLSYERLSDRNKWRDIIYVLCNISKKNKKLAIFVSKKCAEKWDQHVFNKLWDEAISNTKNIKKLTLASLIFWAKEDNFEYYSSLTEESIKSVINKDIFNKILVGDLQEYQYAKYIKILLGDKFITDISADGKKMHWCEFNYPTDEYKNGELFKWVVLPYVPSNITNYIPNQLCHLIESVLDDIDIKIANEEDNKDIIDYLMVIKKNLKKSAKSLSKSGFKSCILKELSSLFNKRGFIETLDKDKHIIGVRNGVIKLSYNPKLITGYHKYAISRSTNVSYYLYEPNCPYTNKIVNTIKLIFPADEQDVYEYLMYYFASCLDGKPKQSLFLILTGNGSNGKSFLIQFVRDVLGDYYSEKLPLSFLTEKRIGSEKADPSLMKLQHIRLAHYSESNPDDVLNTGKLKELTGQESISGRKLFADQLSFKPTCMHLLTTNHPINIKSTDFGIWRRIKTYKFKKSFVENPDTNNKFEEKMDVDVDMYSEDQKLKDAFFSLLVHYYGRLQDEYNGKLINVKCKTIEKETELYRESEDMISRFIAESALYSPGYIDQKLIDAGEIFKEWYMRNINNVCNLTPLAIHSMLLTSSLSKYFKNDKNGSFGRLSYYLHNIRLLSASSEPINPSEKPLKLYLEEKK